MPRPATGFSRWPEQRAEGKGWRAASRIPDPVERLVAVIAASTGPDRQCHVSVPVLSGRARLAVRTTKRMLAQLVADGQITRFKLPNGSTATRLAKPLSPPCFGLTGDEAAKFTTGEVP